jgi:hypothetical protein
MDTAGDMGAIKQMWLKEGGVAAIVPLKFLKKVWPVTCNSRRHNGQFVLHTDQGDIFIKNNSKGMPYLDIRELDTQSHALVYSNSVRQHGRIHEA